MHAIIEMGPGTDAKALCRFAPVFVDAVEKWRDKATKINQGLEVPREAPPSKPGQQPPQVGPSAPGGDRFIKI